MGGGQGKTHHQESVPTLDSRWIHLSQILFRITHSILSLMNSAIATILQHDYDFSAYQHGFDRQRPAATPSLLFFRIDFSGGKQKQSKFSCCLNSTLTR
jgi:hypothetical protein